MVDALTHSRGHIKSSEAIDFVTYRSKVSPIRAPIKDKGACLSAKHFFNAGLNISELICIPWTDGRAFAFYVNQYFRVSIKKRRHMFSYILKAIQWIELKTESGYLFAAAPPPVAQDMGKKEYMPKPVTLAGAIRQKYERK